MLTDYMAALQILQANPSRPIIDLLTNSINGLVGENNRKIKEAIFKDKSSMISAIVEGAQRIHSIREGVIAGKPASVVMAERLSLMEAPELILLAGYIFNSNPEQRWFNHLKGMAQ